MEIPLPQTEADLLPFGAACVTILVGILALLMPRIALRALRMQGPGAAPQAVAEMRAVIGGFYIGFGLLSLLLFKEPPIQMLLGGAWAFSAFGRLVALLSDDVPRLRNGLLLLFSLGAAAAPLSVAFGFAGP